MSWYLQVFKKYAVFQGRARRKEYWMFVLFNIIISFVIGMVERLLGMQPEIGLGILSILYSLVIFIPSLAVSVRRLHDTERSGWMFLVNLIPLVGWIIFLVFMAQDSKPGSNKYGENPKNI